MNQYEFYIYEKSFVQTVFSFYTYDDFSAEAKAKRIFNMLDFPLGVLSSDKGKTIKQFKK